MAETLEKLSPDRDLQCYFQRPSAIAALNETSADGFTVSGSWRQQFDWAVIEWNRDNVFEHPSFRSLPDGDLSGLTLTYEETRSNCILLDSDLFPTVDWPSLRVWADDGNGEKIYRVLLKNYATPIEGAYQPASVQFTLGGTPTEGDYVGLAFLGEHYWALMGAADSLENAIARLVTAVNGSPTVQATSAGRTITLIYVGAGQTLQNSTTAANGNRIGVYTYTTGATEQWDAPWRLFSGGSSPAKWRISLPFANLIGTTLQPVDNTPVPVPVRSVRKLRWTYAAAFQRGEFARSEFQVVVSNWTVTGTGRSYSIAGPGSRRIEDDSHEIHYQDQGAWTTSKGNFSGGSIGYTTTPSAGLSCTYTSAQQHTLYLGTRMAQSCTSIAVSIDGQPPIPINLALPGEDVLLRWPLGQHGPGQHRVAITHTGSAGTFFYFDFIEVAIPANVLPGNDAQRKTTLATDWDTDHSIALAPERTAWIMNRLGFQGRVNHYVGALWFYELIPWAHQYASATVTFIGTPDPNDITEILIGRKDHPLDDPTRIVHLNLLGDTVETLARAFELELNRGYTGIRAEASGNQLTILSRSIGADGNEITLGHSLPTEHLTFQLSGPELSGGMDGDWRTDLQAMPRLNRAARDWTRSFFRALKRYGLDVTASFSMELKDADPSPEVGIAQRYPSQAAVLLNTPSIQTNFSPQSTDFWKQVYADMANVQVEAGLTPYLQFGEVQWWYFPDDKSGMPFYDAYTMNTFRAQYGRDIQVITTNTVDPAFVPDEAVFLPKLIGNFTNHVMDYVRFSIPRCRFEVLYPTDVNNSALNRVINYPRGDWTAVKLDCLKTESFTYTFSRDLNSSKATIDAGSDFGFAPAQRSHLVGINDATTAWLKEARMAEASGLESVVLFALDQFCLVGYALPLSHGMRRSTQMG